MYSGIVESGLYGKRDRGSMTQLPLLGIEASYHMEVVTDYGPTGQGASQAHYVLAENGQEYLIKGRNFFPQHPYVAVDEYVAASLACGLGLPILDYRFVSMAGELCFASAWMTQGTFYPQLEEHLFRRCANCSCVYMMVAFDVWICNNDRHHGNLLARASTPQQRANPASSLQLLLNDHSHCLMSPGEDTGALANKLAAPARTYVSPISFVRDTITDLSLLSSAVDKVEQLNDEWIYLTVRCIPEGLLKPGDRDTIAEFLFERRKRLRDLIEADRACFSKLGGGKI